MNKIVIKSNQNIINTIINIFQAQTTGLWEITVRSPLRVGTFFHLELFIQNESAESLTRRPEKANLAPCLLIPIICSVIVNSVSHLYHLC